MIDVYATVRAFLALNAGLKTLCGPRIYAGVDMPAGYDANKQGPALLFQFRYGSDYTSKLLKGTMLFQCHALKEADALAVERALFDGLHDKTTANIRAAHLDTGGQVLRDNSTGWYMVLSTYQMVMENGG